MGKETHFSKLSADILSKKGVYKIINLINNKIYIGSTGGNFRKRLTSLKNNKKQPVLLKMDMSKYGIENFKIEIVEILNLSLKEIRKRETYWIKFYKSYNRKMGYNVCKTAEHTVRELNYKKVVRFDKYLTNCIIFNSIKEASRISKCPESGITIACKTVNILNNRRSGTSGGYFWCYFTDFKQNLLPINKKSTRLGKGIQKLDKYFNVIAEYKTLTEAATIEDLDFSGIAKCCRGKTKTAYGYIWRYIN